MGRVINIKFDEDNIVGFDSDTPDFKLLVSVIIKKLDMDFTKVEVTCEDSDFDSEAFRLALTDSIVEFRKNLEIDKNNLDQSISSLTEKRKIIDLQCF